MNCADVQAGTAYIRAECQENVLVETHQAYLLNTGHTRKFVYFLCCYAHECQTLVLCHPPSHFSFRAEGSAHP